MLQIYHGTDLRYTFFNLEYNIEYNFRVCPVRVMPSGEHVNGIFSTVTTYTIKHLEDKKHQIESDIASKDLIDSYVTLNGHSIVAKANENMLLKFLNHVLSMYQNRDKFTDQQKAIIYVAVLMVAALICAAIVEMFLR